MSMKGHLIKFDRALSLALALELEVSKLRDYMLYSEEINNNDHWVEADNILESFQKFRVSHQIRESKARLAACIAYAQEV